MNDQVAKLREFLASSRETLLSVEALSHATGLPQFQIVSLLRFVQPAWANSEFYDRAELLRVLETETPLDGDDFAPEEPLPPLGCKLILEGNRNV